MFKKFNFYLFIFLISFSLNQSYVLANIFLNNGKDLRTELTSNENFPLNTIGVLDSGCIATLLSSRIVITSSHCVITDKGDIASDLKYFIISGQKIGIEKIFAKTKTFPSRLEDPELLNDWAFIILEDNEITKSLEFMELAKVEFQQISQNPDSTYNVKSLFPYEVGFVGLDMDLQKLMYDRSCLIFKQESGLLYHNCSSTSGGSGGTLFSIVNKTPKIVALMIAEKRQGANTSLKLEKYSNIYANIAIPVQDEIISTFNELKQAVSNGLASKDIELAPPLDLIAINYNDVKRMSILPRATNDSNNNGNATNLADDNTPKGPHSILERDDDTSTPDTNTYTDNSTPGPHSILEREDGTNNNPQGYNNPSYNGNTNQPTYPSQDYRYQQQPQQYRPAAEAYDEFIDYNNIVKVRTTTDALIRNINNLANVLVSPSLGIRGDSLTLAIKITRATQVEASFIRALFEEAITRPGNNWINYVTAINASIRRMSSMLGDLTNLLVSINKIRAPILRDRSYKYQFVDLFNAEIPLRIPNTMLRSSLRDVGIAFFSVVKMFK